MPDFQKFLSSLNAESMDSMLREAVGNISLSPISNDALEAICKISSAQIIAMLRIYHDWLQKNRE
jgi:hypothetical protein